MTVRVIMAELCGETPLAAAARFHREVLPIAEDTLAHGHSLVIRFDYGEEKPHRWRREVVAALAREYAPLRVNAVAPAQRVPDPAKMDAVAAFLSVNGGVTGQLLLAG